MQKIRCLGEIPTNWEARSGPPIGSCNDLYFLKDEPWLEIRRSSLADCKRDGVIPWIRSGARGAILECEKLNLPVIIGPNCVFGCSDIPEGNLVELRSPVIHRLLMSDEMNAALARALSINPDRVRQVPYFMRPELYNEPFTYEYEYDLYVHCKGDFNKSVWDLYRYFTCTQHGWYVFKELKYKAQHSTVCLHACPYDNYGLAIHEISLLGCPIVYDRMGFKTGSIGEGMGVEIENVKGDINILKDALDKAMAMDRKKVWEASHEYQSIENCKRRYREAML